MENNEEKNLPSAEELVDEHKSDRKNFQSKVRKNPWQIASVVLGIALLVLLVFFMSGGITGNVIREGEAGEKIVSYLNSRVGGGVEFVSSNDLGNLYEVIVSYQGDEIPVYISKDGDYFISGIQPLVVAEEEIELEQELVKSEIPMVELFVMTHCPYGTQAEKGMIPVFELLGDKIDSSVKFVHYFMHAPEEEETARQVCIREEQGDKYLDYLKCFLEGDGNADASGYIANNKDSGTCMKEAGIDETEVQKCVDDNAEDYYADDSELSQMYGVGGSPALVINGVQVSSARSPAAYLDTICSAFIDAPEECNEILSSETSSPGFGWGSGNDSGGQC